MPSAADARLAREALIEKVGSFIGDPLGFVRYAFPWGEPGTPLANMTGPRKWQAELLEEMGRRLERQHRTGNFEPIQFARASGHGVGKVLSNEIIVPTPEGMRRWGDILVGDMLFDRLGKPTRVLSKYTHKNWPFYKITFDDGSATFAGLEHLWQVRGRQERRKGLLGWRVMSTEDIIRAGVKRPNGTAEARQWEIPKYEPAEFDGREIDLHPYVMGVWLGDGTKGKPEYTKPYPEIKSKIESLGYTVSTQADGTRQRIVGAIELFCDPVHFYGSHERYIPDDYKFNTAANRWELFCGLMDTDGEVHGSGSIGYSTTSEQLAKDVIWLARSLGFKANIQDAVKSAWYPDEDGGRIPCRPCWRLTINASRNPFTLEHRKSSYKISEDRYRTRWIDSIEFSHYGDGHCVRVENDESLYLANDFIVTHNSCLVAWLILWAMSTKPMTRVMVTANTEPQLRTKTWPEVQKWLSMMICRHWFSATATKLESVDPAKAAGWRADALPWSAENTEAFAGLHNQGRRIVLLFDEASSIDNPIWEVAEGALTDEQTEIIWAVFGNPTRTEGRFRDCFGRFAHRWDHRALDSRQVEGTNKELLNKWVEDWGEDSDFVRVRVRGMFPRAGVTQFMPSDLVEAAATREVYRDRTAPLIMGVDVARGGDAMSVIRFRRGRDARTIAPVKMRTRDTVEYANRIAEQAHLHQVDAIFVDGGGVGGGVIDQLRRMVRTQVTEVQFGAKPDRAMIQELGTARNVYASKRAEMWGTMRDWLVTGAIDHDDDLLGDLLSIEYGYVQRDGRDAIQISPKSMTDQWKELGRAAGVNSRVSGRTCDDGDALALTFAYPVVPMALAPTGKQAQKGAYNPYAGFWKTYDREGLRE